MKKIFISICFLFAAQFIKAQGLEDIIVEKYYVADENDATDADGGSLVKGSVTYRIYVDMRPGYKFQAIYGLKEGLGHELRIKTTTTFFNNADRGATTANSIPGSQLKNNTIMLDSWVSVGGAGSTYFGVLKSDDKDGAIANADGFLQNADPSAGIPLKTADGLVVGKPEVVTTVGIDSALNAVFADANAGPEFFSNNGSWASLNGSMGPNDDNKVLVAQITTDGDFSYELNVQIGTPDGRSENYVARNAVDKDILLDACIFPRAKNARPKVELLTPVDGATYLSGTTIPITANASDSDGTISAVTFFVDGIEIGVDSIAPFQSTWKSNTPGTAVITAVATDNAAGRKISNEVKIIISDQSAINNLPTTIALFNAYPNPTSDAVNLELITTKQTTINSYTLYDINGNLILSKSLGAIAAKYEGKIDLSALASGQYIVELMVDGARSYKRIIKN